jgi:tRNA nucleotidyltransferase (CCA-adding enzyme)
MTVQDVTPTEELPQHIMYEIRGVAIIEMCNRLHVPPTYREIARLVSRYHLNVHRAHELRESTLLEVLQKLDAFRRPECFAQLLLAYEADARGRKGLENREYSQTDYLRAARAVAAKVTLDPSLREGLDGQQIALQLRQLRLKALVQIKKEN